MLNTLENQSQTQPVELKSSSIIYALSSAFYDHVNDNQLDDEEWYKRFICHLAKEASEFCYDKKIDKALEKKFNTSELQMSYIESRFGNSETTKLYKALFPLNANNIKSYKGCETEIIYRLYILDFAIKFSEKLKTSTEVMSLCKDLYEKISEYQKEHSKSIHDESLIEGFFEHFREEAALEQQENGIDGQNNNTKFFAWISNVFKSLWNAIVKAYKWFANEAFAQSNKIEDSGKWASYTKIVTGINELYQDCKDSYKDQIQSL